MCLSFSVVAQEEQVFYIGTNLETRRLLFTKAYSMRAESPRYLEGSAYAGVGLSDFWKVELGYHRARQSSGLMNLAKGEPCMGQSIRAQDGVGIKATTLLNGFSISHVVLLPIWGHCSCFRLLGMAGFSREHLRTDFSYIYSGRIQDGWSKNFVFEGRSWIPHVGIGFQKMIHCTSFGFRGMVRWEETSKFGYILEKKNKKLIMRPQNSMIFGLGIIYFF